MVLDPVSDQRRSEGNAGGGGGGDLYFANKMGVAWVW